MESYHHNNNIRKPSIIITEIPSLKNDQYQLPHIIEMNDYDDDDNDKCFNNQNSDDPAQQSLTKTALYLIRYNVALQISFSAMLVSLFLAIATFYYGTNSLYCAFGVDSIIGVLTSIILIWRFASSKHEQSIYRSNNDDELLPLLNSSRRNSHVINNDDDYIDDNYNNNHERIHPLLRSLQSTIDDTPDDNQRELWSTFWLGQIMILSGFSVIIRSLIELVCNIIENVHNHQVNNEENLVVLDPSNEMLPLYLLSLISLSLNIILMAFKLFVYYHLNSNSMLIEGVNSFLSAIFALILIFSIHFHDSIDYIDQIVSILFGVFLVSYGIYNVLHTLAYTVVELIKKKYSNNHSNDHHHSHHYLQHRRLSASQRQLNLLNHHHHHNQRRKSSTKSLHADYLQIY